VRLQRHHDLLRLRVLADGLGDHGVLHKRHVGGDMGIVVLVDERLDRLADERIHVLADRIGRFRVVLGRNKFVGILDAKHLDHLAMKLREVVNLRSLLRHLQHRLVLHDALGHGAAVRITDGDHVHHHVVHLASTHFASVRLICVLRRGVLGHDRLEHLELLLHGVVDPSLHRSHGLEGPLKERQRGSDRGVSRHVGDVHVTDSAQAPPFRRDLVQEGQQGLARLLVGQGHDVVADRPAGHVHVLPLAGLNRRVVTLDTQPTGLEAPRKVG
jgi:hypothetical protein